MKAGLCHLHEDTSSNAQNLFGVVFLKTCFLTSKKQYGEFLSAIRQYNNDCDEKILNVFSTDYDGTVQSGREDFIRDWMKLARGCLPKRSLLEKSMAKLGQGLSQYDFYKLF